MAIKTAKNDNSLIDTLASKLDLAGGKILQVVGATHSTEVSTTSTSIVTTGLSATITPVSASNKVLVLAMIGARKTTDNIFSGPVISLHRGTVADTALGENVNIGTGANFTAMVGFTLLDSPSTTSAQTYTLGIKTISSLTTVASCPGNRIATMALLEVSA